MDWELYTRFILVSIVVLALPGPSFLYVLAISRTKNVAQVAANIMGLASGGLLLSTLIAVGLAKILLVIPSLLIVLKWVGGLYLIYLGIQAMVKRKQNQQTEEIICSPTKAFIQGFMVEALNPKTLLFYVSLLPQFINPEKSASELQLFALGFTFVAMQVVCDMLVFVTFRTILRSVKGLESQPVFSFFSRWFSGVVLSVLGLYLLTSEI